MTCIVGWNENGNIWIGGDSAGVAGYSMSIRKDEKVFVKDEFAFGFTSSFRMGQLIRYNFSIPKREEKQSTEDYLHNKFLGALIACFKDNNYAAINNNQITGGCFIMGYRGDLYYVDNDFQIGKQVDNFFAVGCGSDIALGCLFALKNEHRMTPEERIIVALEASERYSAGVRRPFHVVKILQNKKEE